MIAINGGGNGRQQGSSETRATKMTGITDWMPAMSSGSSGGDWITMCNILKVKYY
jgi:hypothetical protein